MINALHRMRIRLLKREAMHWENATSDGFTERYRSEQRGLAIGARNSRMDIEALLEAVGEECP